MNRFAKSALGVTLLEIMLVLAVAAMIIVMSIRYYQSASTSAQANAALEMIQGITAAADGIAQPAGTYTGATTTAVQALMPNQSMSTPWGGTITLGSQGATVYTVTFDTMPTNVCNILRPKVIANTKFNNSVSACSGGSFAYTYDATK